ncbi:putative Fe-S oxidoreductase [Terriglobus roseus DSM 18391]|uniref:Putative Fe-S oxidoreductase n=1 Tax=Terriglobus roseus (strain DSM 18391 / NRRL B-41598 / KBS 63) TaxID=926566 RepID=I3ZJD5_TERRK|nr:radical SAM protein [Terriglobus roseus]AFL89353.1 putative Fe-S oxidoreductase [Terriglobus roseus DSM 18391]
MSLISRFANASWTVLNSVGRKDGQLPTPSWSTSRLLKRTERHFPPLGPRFTQSVCPACQLETRDAIIRGRGKSSSLFADEALIEAEVVEVNGQVVMRKYCARHGQIEDVLARDASFFWRMEKLFPGCDFPRRENADSLGSHTVQYGRGSFLIIDLTTRCNMKCEPCFMNANEIGHVHELSLSDIRKQLDYALTVEPRREINILFSGGEPTISAHFLEAVAYAKSIGLHRLHAATNGLRFAEDPSFAIAAKGAGLHGVYLQLDGVTNDTNVHRGIGNLFDLKVKALDNISAAGLHTTLQVTVINGVNNARLAEIVEFAAKRSDQILGVVFQPVMFTGRDEQITETRRKQQRYTLSDLSDDLSQQSGIVWMPGRDWFPMATYNTLAILLDTLNPHRAMGSTCVNAHPDASVVSPLIVNRTTGEPTPLASFFNVERFLNDMEAVLERGRGALMSKASILASLRRNFEQRLAPINFRFTDLLQLASRSAARFDSSSEERIYSQDKWSLLIASGMWFQDLFNYELPNIQLSTALVADLGVEGLSPSEISFSFKNAVGWRQIVENHASVPTLSDWHRSQGRHAIYANGVSVTVDELTSSLKRCFAEEPSSGGYILERFSRPEVNGEPSLR